MAQYIAFVVGVCVLFAASFFCANLDPQVEGLQSRPAPVPVHKVADAPMAALSVVRAQAFVLVDGANRERAALGMKDGVVRFYLRDKDGVQRIEISISEDNVASVSLRDALKSPKALITVQPDGSSRITLRDGAGKELTIIP